MNAMVALWTTVLFLFGLVVGSFTNVLIYRIPRGIDWKWTRSFCPKCSKPLGPADLIPLLSFALYKARCRYCEKPVSWKYPVVEGLVAFGFVGAFFWLQPHALSGASVLTFSWVLILIPILVALTFIDLEHFLLPDGLIGVGVAVTIFYRVMLHFIDGGWLTLWIDGAAALGLVLFFWVLILLTRGKGMGFGDVKLAFLVGMVSGWPGMLASTFAAFVLGAMVGVMLIVFQKKTLKAEIPFGPFLIVGSVIGLIFGESMISIFFGF